MHHHCAYQCPIGRATTAGLIVNADDGSVWPVIDDGFFLSCPFADLSNANIPRTAALHFYPRCVI
jgi:hypothetical protein